MRIFIKSLENYEAVITSRNTKIKIKNCIYYYKCKALSFINIIKASKIMMVNHIIFENPKITPEFEWEFFTYSPIINLKKLWKDKDLDEIINSINLIDDF